VLMAEHDRSFDQTRWEKFQDACRAVSITLIPGIEYEDGDSVVRTPVWGEHVPFLGAGRPTLELLQAAQSEGAVAVLAHPWRRNAISRYRAEWAPLLSAVEVWNRKYDGIAPNREAASLAAAADMGRFAALDFHTSRQFFPLAIAIEVADPPTASTLVDAIRKGNFRPEFIGLPVLRFTGGLEGTTLRGLEAARRALRRSARTIKPRHSPQPPR